MLKIKIKNAETKQEVEKIIYDFRYYLLLPYNHEKKVYEIENIGKEPENAGTIRQPENNKLVKQGFWNKFKAFWLQDIDWNKEIKVVLKNQQ